MFQKEVFNNERVRFSRKMVKELIYLFHSLPTGTLWIKFELNMTKGYALLK